MISTATKTSTLDQTTMFESEPHIENDEMDCTEVWLTEPRFSCVRCEISQNHVVLRGTVTSFHLKQLAQEHLRHNANPREIINELAVRKF